MNIIKNLKALEILDSRGRPTVKAYCELDSGTTGSASVPSGASTGKAEAHELRDGELRFDGLGCKKAVNNIETIIQQDVRGRKFSSQQELDLLLTQLDGTPNKSRLGANSILAVSLAFARAVASESRIPLYQYFSNMGKTDLQFLPRPTINLFSGGIHAGGQVPVQDLLLVPKQHKLDQVYDATYRIYNSAAGLSSRKYGVRTLSADEGGLAPPFTNQTAMFEDAMEAIRETGFEAGREIALALDVASSHFYDKGKYQINETSLDGPAMIGLLESWSNDYPIISIEDGLHEEDWENWSILMETMKGKCLILGDDLLCTNPTRINHAIQQNAANALLLKVNQIGTLSEALASNNLARNANWSVTISARSGETEDSWLADLAFGWQADFIKVGSITQSERLSKYNRLLEIERETGLEIR